MAVTGLRLEPTVLGGNLDSTASVSGCWLCVHHALSLRLLKHFMNRNLFPPGSLWPLQDVLYHLAPILLLYVSGFFFKCSICAKELSP